jgi:hypothetical protein
LPADSRIIHPNAVEVVTGKITGFGADSLRTIPIVALKFSVDDGDSIIVTLGSPGEALGTGCGIQSAAMSALHSGPNQRIGLFERLRAAFTFFVAYQ